MALVDYGHGDFSNNNNDSVFDVVCLHATNDNKLYKPDIVESIKSKEIESNKHNWFESTKSNFIATILNKSNKPVALGV